MEEMIKEPIFGIPLVVNKYIPEGEVWMIQEGKKTTIHCHEGPQAGQDIEEWLKEPKIVKIINLGKSEIQPLPPPSIKLKK
jgi:hypothetical protein